MYEFEVIRSKRKTVALEIKSDLRIIVRAPMEMKQWEIERFVSQKASWIEKHASKMKERAKEHEGEEPFTSEYINWLADNALAVIPQRTEQLAEKMGVSYGRITIRNQKTRWGSCSSKGNLNFNCLLVLCPTEVLDYVIIHELCHLREMNHSNAFWCEVEKFCPDYRTQRNWLKRNGNSLIARMK